MDQDLYETDFYTWTQRQAEHLRAGRLSDADLENIAEEIDSLGKSYAAALRSAYRLVALHLLKLLFQPGKATKSWRITIGRERLNIAELLKDHPGLKPRREELFQDAYETARRLAAIETGLSGERFPKDAPFTIDEVESESVNVSNLCLNAL